MQSPLVFDPNSYQQSPFLPLAQMFLTSPQIGMHQQLPSAFHDNGENGTLDEREIKRRVSMMNSYGMITPGESPVSSTRLQSGPSGEMIPQPRIDQMSPMQLEMLSRGENGVSLALLSRASEISGAVF